MHAYGRIGCGAWPIGGPYNKNQNVYGVLIKISVSLHIFDFSSSNVAVLDDS